MPLTNHIAIYGGSFNPPHFGHQIACMWLLYALNARGVLVVPTYEHYFGKDLEDFSKRLEMCKLMIKPIKLLDNKEVIVSDIEKDLPLPNTTFNLVNKVKELERLSKPEIAVVVGTDLVPHLHKWHKWDEVAEMAKIIAVGRSGFNDVESKYDIYKYPIELSAISSSEIRERIKSKKPITGLVSYDIGRYIYENSLYA